MRYKSFITDKEVLKVVEQVHTNRLDPSRDVIRSVESREGNRVVIKPMHTIVRKKGALQLIMNCTVDMQGDASCHI